MSCLLSRSLIIFCIICVLVETINSARILAVYPAPSISHQVVFRPLMQELAKRGHEVVVITTDPAFPKGKCPQNLSEIDVHDLSYKMWHNFLDSGEGIQFVKSAKVLTLILKTMTAIFKAQFNSEDVQKLINDKNLNFDLLFVEACFRPALSFSYLYDIPAIEFSSFGGLPGIFEISGAPMNPLVYALPYRQRIYNLSLWDKIFELHDAYAIDAIYEEQEMIDNKVLRELFGPKVPDVSELRKNVEMTFLNVHHIWDFNRPVPPNIVYLGGIHHKPPKDLPKDLQTYLDKSKKDVIYISFGTNARPSLLPAEKLRILTNVFCQVPYNILLKWDEDELDGRCENIMISKWFPQSDLLRHPKVKLFITQGGLQSTDEALSAGVPLIAIPFLGDQWYNAEHYVKFNIGIQINIEDLTEAKLKNGIQSIINNQTYRENVVRLHKLMQDQPQPPLERAVWWTEYVLRNGGSDLRSAAAHMSWSEYYALDLVLLFITAVIIVIVAIMLAISYFISLKNNLKFKIKIN